MIYFFLLSLYTIEIFSFFLIAYLVSSKKHNRASKEFATFALLVGIWQMFQFFAIVTQGQPFLSSIFVRVSVFISPFFSIKFFAI